MDRATQIYKEWVREGTAGLVHAFSICIDEMFKPALIVEANGSGNPYADLPLHVKSAIVQSAFTKGLAQSLASMVLVGEKSGITDKQVMSMGRNVLKHEFEQFLKAWKKVQHENSMGKGPAAEPAGGRLIHDPSPEGGPGKEQQAVSDDHHCGQDGCDRD